MDFVHGEIFLPALGKTGGEGRRQIDKRRQTKQYYDGGSYSDAFQHVLPLSIFGCGDQLAAIGGAVFIVNVVTVSVPPMAISRPPKAELLFPGSRFLENSGYEAPVDLDPDLVGNFKGDHRLRQTGHLALNAAGGHHGVPVGQIGDHVFDFLLFLLLRSDHQKIKDSEKYRHHYDEADIASSGAGSSSTPG